MLKFVKGRENLSVTVFVPFDCDNGCKFCSSKQEYKKGTNFESVLEQLKEFRYSDIEEIVFTGGEPMADLEKLKVLVKAVNNKKVFINTSLINKNVVEFIDFINQTDCIKGVNISRHHINYDQDCKFLKNIAPDVLIKFIKKPVKINVVKTEGIIDEKESKAIIERWSNLGCNNLTVCFRTDYRKRKNIHDLSDPNIAMLSNFCNYSGRSFCDVCDTTYFKYNNICVSYHRGTMIVTVKFGDTLEINDIIIDQLGNLYYDWDHKKENLEEFKEAFNISSDNSTISGNIMKAYKESRRPTISCGGPSLVGSSSIRFGTCYGGGRC